MDRCRRLLQCVLLLSSMLLVLSDSGQITKLPLLMPAARVPADGAYICTSVKMDPNRSKFIVGFEPNATMARAHHVSVYGCTTPGSHLQLWDCGSKKKVPGLKQRPECQSGYQTIFVWAHNAPEFDLPEGVGFQVGGDTDIQHLVLQIHYTKKLPAEQRDSSGVFLRMTERHLARRAAILTFGTAGKMAARRVTSWENACAQGEYKTLHPAALRVHTHELGACGTLYKVRRGWLGGDTWTMLGRRDPQLPQAFIPVRDTAAILHGDRLAARCTFNNTMDQVVKAGNGKNEEMCVIHFLYWVEGTTPLSNKYCYSEGPPRYSWAKSNSFNNIPQPDAVLMT